MGAGREGGWQELGSAGRLVCSRKTDLRWGRCSVQTYRKAEKAAY